MLAFGIDQLIELNPDWKNQRLGLLTNEAAKSIHGMASRKLLIDHGYNLKLLFSPEHGLDSKGEDGKLMPDGIDPLTGMKVISLYGQKLAPNENDLSDIDILLFDIPDIGARFYTYLWSLTHLMESATKLGKKLVVLDRPNPISGDLTLAEGPMLEEDESVRSFIGRWSIPIRHSCTLGELASYFKSKRNIGTNLEIIPCKNWNRTSFQPDWGTAFVPTSPAIQDFESMVLYPGLCLLEATNISEGRGTDQSFKIAGAPWMNGKIIANLFNQLGLEDVKAKPIVFKPTHSKYQGELCEGIAFSVKDFSCFQSVTNGLLLINLIKSIYPQLFKWSVYPTEVNPTGENHLDKLLGLRNSKSLFNLPLQQFLLSITKCTNTREWRKEIEPYLLY